jgi:hypothetical protein
MMCSNINWSCKKEKLPRSFLVHFRLCSLFKQGLNRSARVLQEALEEEERDRQRQRERETERQRDRETERQRDRDSENIYT